MDAALAIPELRTLICEEATPLTLVALARVSRSFSELALNSLYYGVHLDEILRVLPSELWKFHEHFRGFSFAQPLVDLQCLEPLHRHARRVHTLIISDDLMSGSVLPILAAAAAELPIPLFPALKKLDASNISVVSILTEFWSHTSLFFSPTLEHFAIITHGPDAIPLGPLLHQATRIHRLPQYAPNIQHLYVMGSPDPPAPILAQAFTSAFRSWNAMQTVELDSVDVSEETMEALSALADFRKLHITSDLPNMILEPGQGFPALEDLNLVCPPETFAAIMKRTSTSGFRHIEWYVTPKLGVTGDILHPFVFMPAPAKVETLHIWFQTHAPAKADLLGLAALSGLTHLTLSVSSSNNYENDDLNSIIPALPLLQQFYFKWGRIEPDHAHIFPCKINAAIFHGIIEHLFQLTDLALPLDLLYIPPPPPNAENLPPSSSQVHIFRVVSCPQGITWDTIAFTEYLLHFFPLLEVLHRPYNFALDPNKKWWEKVIDCLTLSKHATDGIFDDMLC
ncbi:hypothetical protein DL96DRAFT_1616120 [Flagelloscypha sp. PMI_526]|nr:hypothetical protein DL96DRAFT_1616120 [Flagelloscypha sp. PMI_526]